MVFNYLFSPIRIVIINVVYTSVLYIDGLGV